MPPPVRLDDNRVALRGAALLLQAPVVELARADWRCSATHGEKHQVQRPDGWMEFQTIEVCDQWSRR